MYLQEILEVAIGLVFVWLVMSLAAMQFNEWISNGLRWRANDLEKAIQQMLASDDLAKQLYSHPLIANLYQPPKRPGKKPLLPSYIPANKFAAALFDLVIYAGTDASPVKNLTGQVEAQLSILESPEQQKLAKEDWNAILQTAKQVAASGLGESAVDSLKARLQAYGAKYPELQAVLDQAMPEVDTFYQQFLEEQRAIAAEGPDMQLAMRQFRLGMMALSKTNAKLKESMVALVRSAETTAVQGEKAIATARTSFESWFNDAMDRLTGSYKRKAQLVTFLIGFALALVLNVDTINAATSLWREPTFRQAIIAQADAYAQQNQPVTTATSGSLPNPLQAVPELQNQLKVLKLPFGWTDQPVASQQAIACDPFAPTAYDSQGQPTRIMGVHIGSLCYPLINAPALTPDSLLSWLTKLLGLVITAAATAQGAPFWFDTLKKLINVRSAGPNPSEKPVG